jgi:1-acyl-sn-glycerol-3-phosphate acyltransferase
MARRAGEEVRRGRQLIIFPESTRTPVDAPPNYKSGVGLVYVDSNVTCLPVALNSGLFWPGRTAIPGRSWSNFSIHCRPACSAVNSSRASAP